MLTEAVVHEGHELATNFCPCLQFGSSVEGIGGSAKVHVLSEGINHL